MTKFRVGSSKAAKLTPSQVYELREKYSLGQTQGSLAREYGLSVGQVGRIVRGESWNRYANPAEELPQLETEAELERLSRESQERLRQRLNDPSIEEDKAFLDGQKQRGTDL